MDWGLKVAFLIYSIDSRFRGNDINTARNSCATSFPRKRELILRNS